MPLVVDLHSHSYYSDGGLSPVELINRAHEKGVQILALTDHDETKGLHEARTQAELVGLDLINGVEISVSWNGKTIHIVGLGIDPNNSELQQGLQLVREERIRRARKIAQKLHKCGIENVWEEIVEKVGFEAVTRTHIAAYLVEKGHARDMQQAFKRFLARKGKAFVNGHWMALEKSVKLIREAGGQAVIAHPVRYRMSRMKLEEMVQAFKEYGGAGIEVVTSRYSPHEKAAMASIARRFNLLASVGSDFHFPGSPFVELGHRLDLPTETRGIWEEWPEYKALQAVV